MAVGEAMGAIVVEGNVMRSLASIRVWVMNAVTNQGQEGWWMIAEGVRPKGAHNTRVGRAPMLVTDLSQEKISTQFDFVVPEEEGVYKFIIHMRNTTILGVDFSKKYEFKVATPPARCWTLLAPLAQLLLLPSSSALF